MSNVLEDTRLKGTKPPGYKQHRSPDLTGTTLEDRQEDRDEANIALLASYIVSKFIRRDGKFYVINGPSVTISATDLKRIAYHQAIEAFPEVELTDQLWSAVCKRAINDTHSARA